MATRATIDLTSLDFDVLKSSLTAFLKTQDTFKDYNYEGASINVLLDILTANSTYYATYASFIANESFSDSSILRSSVVSRAKERGYVPRSARASKISVGMTVVGITGSPASVNISKNISFKGIVNGQNYNFVTVANQGLFPTDFITGTYAGIVDAYEGSLITSQFQIINTTTRFIIPNKGIDTSHMRVVVQNSLTDQTTTEYAYVDNILALNASSKVYFLQEVDGGLFEVVFGDGQVGYKPQVGNIVLVEYLVCSQGFGDGISTVTLNDNLFPAQTVTLLLTLSSSGSSIPESIDSIKNNMKIKYNAQDRAVIPSDYKEITTRLVPDLLDINVWGGEDNNPPLYGKTIISIVTNSFEPIPAIRKNAIVGAIKLKNVTGIRPMIIDAEMYRIKLNGRIKVNRELMNIPETDLVAGVKSTMRLFSVNNLQKFAKSFQYSQLTTQIDNYHVSIVSSLFDVFLVNKLYPNQTAVSSYKLLFGNVIGSGTLTCSPFYIQNSRPDTVYYIEDINGLIRIYGITSGDITTKTYENGYFGTVDYTTGEVVISQVQVRPVFDPVVWTIEVKVTDKDISSAFNQVLFLDETLSTINVVSI